MAASKTPAEIAAERRRMGRPVLMRGPLGQLAERLGSRIKLADAIGVAPRSIGRWADGSSKPPRPTRKALAALALAHGIEPPYETGPECPRPAWLDEVVEGADDDEEDD